ncbi:hypothetical protein C8F04DRAFT_1104815 [Mycena alexandri]|uniref:Uncharacterized protein n=1 Tax=Mycena alexandri TaxID=1745969 RepID=A0AAD6ST53_9AGAR|nr:hypothetical protein C8F04DRAFT_1104815 [Mycena alexandri]
MSHTSPSTYLVWTIMGGILLAFLLFHLWSFDRFKCLKWNNGPYSGAFKRVMTYSYLLSVPLLLSYSVGFTIIKYQQGFFDNNGQIIPTPSTMWPESAQRAIFPLTLAFSVGWGMEMISHLEELCFWLFLVNSGSVQQDWFRSWYFRTWIFGSVFAIIYMPLLTIFTRSDPLRMEAYTFLGGSLGSLSLTLWFIPILWAFPAFLASLKSEGVDTPTIVRLTKFHELNMIRIVFRFIFVIPFVILGVDGVRPHVHINESMFWTDFLTMVSAFGCCISSAITLVIFFPRSVEGEIAAKDAARAARRTRSHGGHPTASNYTAQNRDSRYSEYSQNNQYPLSPDIKQEYDDGLEVPQLPIMRPNRRRGEDVEMGGFTGLTEGNLSQHNLRPGNLNPLVHNFTSPIDLFDGERPPPTRLAFNQRQR